MLTRRLHENAAVAPQDGARLREAAALAADAHGLPVSPPRLPAAGPNGGEECSRLSHRRMVSSVPTRLWLMQPHRACRCEGLQCRSGSSGRCLHLS